MNTVDVVQHGLEDLARVTANRAKDGTLKVDGEVYTFMFDQARWVYEVTDSAGALVVTFNTKRITVARRYLREYLAS
jgi:hypothetical protein